MTNFIATVIMGMLVITTIVAFARTNKTGSNNLFVLLWIAIAAGAVVAWNIVNPSWWALAILAYSITMLYLVLRKRQNNLINKGCVNEYYCKTRLIKTLYVLIACVVSTLGVLYLISNWTWYTTIVWIPLIAIGILMFFWWIHDTLNKI